MHNPFYGAAAARHDVVNSGING